MDQAISNKPQRRADIYAAPRRFDLGTIFVVTVAYALLFAVMRALHFPLLGVAIVGLFITVVGASQAVLFKGRAPRLASVLAGSSFYLVPLAVAMVARTGRGSLPVEVLATWLVSSAVTGGITGYMVGALVGGVFLLIDVCRKRMHRTHPPPEFRPPAE